VLTVVANVQERLDSGAVAHVPSLDVIPDLHHHSGSFMSCTFRSELAHGGDGPVSHHEMHIAHAQSSAVEAKKKLAIL
jgi:hypothetical protein